MIIIIIHKLIQAAGGYLHVIGKAFGGFWEVLWQPKVTSGGGGSTIREDHDLDLLMYQASGIIQQQPVNIPGDPSRSNDAGL